MTIKYNRNGTVRLYWNKNDSRQYGLLINEIEPPAREPEENSYLSAMSQFGITKDTVGVHTFDLADETELDVVDRVIRAIEEADKYFAFVKMDKEGGYDGFFVSDEKPDPAYATFNLDTLKWDLPKNLDNLKARDALLERQGAIFAELDALDKKIIRPMTEGEPEEVEKIVAEKKEKRAELKKIAADLKKLSALE